MRQVTVFRIGEQEFGIDIFRVIEILNPVRVYAIPGMPDFLQGVINMRGMVIPLLDLRKRFNVISSPERERIIIVRVGKQKVGLQVDAVKEIMGFGDEEIFSAPALFRGFRPEYLTGLGRKEGRVVILLNPDMILTVEEKILLQESSAEMGKSVHEGTEETPEQQ